MVTPVQKEIITRLQYFEKGSNNVFYNQYAEWWYEEKSVYHLYLDPSSIPVFRVDKEVENK